jgi:hypothetical protein
MNQPQSIMNNPAIQEALTRRANGNIRMDAGGAPAGPIPPGAPAAAPETPAAPAPMPGAPEPINPDIAGIQAPEGASIPDDVKMIVKVLIQKLTKLL